MSSSRTSSWSFAAGAVAWFVVAPSPAVAADWSIGVAGGPNYTALQTTREEYTNTNTQAAGTDPDNNSVDVDGAGLGVSGQVLARATLNDWSAVRLGARLGYGKGRLEYDKLVVDIEGEDPVELPWGGSLDGSAAWVMPSVGGEAHLGAQERVRPYLLADVGPVVSFLWPRAKGDENNLVTCAVSSKCNTTEEAENVRAAAGLGVAAGLGLALPNPDLRFELSFIRHALGKVTWPTDSTSPAQSMSFVELSVGYAF